MQKLVFRLTSHAGPHPRSRDRLLRHIAASFGPKLSEPQQTEVLEALITRGIVTIDANDNASYPLTAVDPDSTIS